MLRIYYNFTTTTTISTTTHYATGYYVRETELLCVSCGGLLAFFSHRDKAIENVVVAFFFSFFLPLQIKAIFVAFCYWEHTKTFREDNYLTLECIFYQNSHDVIDITWSKQRRRNLLNI